MSASVGSSGSRINSGNGGTYSITGVMWKQRGMFIKACALILLLSNLYYFASRYIDLTNIVRRLEVERIANGAEKVKTPEKIVPVVTATAKDNELQLNYSQKKYYPYILNEPNKCSDDNLKPLPVFLLIVVKSVTSQFGRRRAVRMTWGNEGNIEGIIIKRIFLLAKGGDPKKQSLLEEEAQEYQDIIQGNFYDSFRNLTVKDIMFMRWMTTHCSQVKFIFKGDDDMFVNIDNIVDYLVSLSPENAKNLFVGSVLYPSPRITDPRSKYYVSTNLWSEKYYPPYVSGGGFLMSSLVSKKIFEVAKITPIFPIDDAFLGVCLKKLGIKPQDHKGFKSWGVSRPKDICIYREIMTSHGLSGDDLIIMWKKLHEANFDFSDCTAVFKVVPGKKEIVMKEKSDY